MYDMPQKMKGGFHGIRSKQISLVLLALVCTIILIWGCERTSILSSFILQDDQLSQLSRDILIDDSEPRPVLPKDSSQVNDGVESELDKKNNPEEHEQRNHQDTGKIPVDNKDTSGKALTAVEEGIIATGDEMSSDGKTEEAQPQTSEEGNPVDVDQNPENTNPTTDLESTLSNQIFNKSVWTRNEKQVCNYGKGKWVKDESRPLYSGFKCKRWLSAMWACRLTQRTDFAYEKLRWQPKDCDMYDFQGENFLARMRHKTLTFVGDSLGRQQFQSMMCMITGGEDRPEVQELGSNLDL